MSTNYYFISKKERQECLLHNNRVSDIFDEVVYNLKTLDKDANTKDIYSTMWGFMKEATSIHIGKRSFGWKPLFQTSDHFRSMREMKEWYLKNKNEYVIEDEYGEELTWDELKEELFEWKGSKKSVRENCLYSTYFTDEDGYEWTTGEFF